VTNRIIREKGGYRLDKAIERASRRAAPRGCATSMLRIQIRLLGFWRGLAAWWRIRRHRSWTCPIDDSECGSDCMFWPRGCTESRRHNNALTGGQPPQGGAPC